MNGRAREAERVLRGAGIPGARVDACGRDGEIAAVRVPEEHWPRLLGAEAAELLGAIRSLGFRFVTVDLDLASSRG